MSNTTLCFKSPIYVLAFSIWCNEVWSYQCWIWCVAHAHLADSVSNWFLLIGLGCEACFGRTWRTSGQGSPSVGGATQNEFKLYQHCAETRKQMLRFKITVQYDWRLKRLADSFPNYQLCSSVISMVAARERSKRGSAGLASEPRSCSIFEPAASHAWCSHLCSNIRCSIKMHKHTI